MPEPFLAVKVGPFACFCVNSAGDAVARDTEVDYLQADRLNDMGDGSLEKGSGAASSSGAPKKGRRWLHKEEPPLADGETRMPDAANDMSTSTDWINEVVAAFWPRISAAVHKIMDETVAPMVNEQMKAHHVGLLANFKFTKFTLGDEAPRIDSVTVRDITTRTGEAGVALVFPIDLQSNIDVEMHAFVASLGAKSIVFRGELAIALLPLIDEVPVVGGLVIGFHNTPTFSMDFTGLASVAELRGLDWVVHDVINQVMASVVVVPNVIAVPLGTKEQGVDQAELNNPPPSWVLRVTALRAKGLVGNDWHMFSKATSDPFVRGRVADQIWQSSVIDGTCDPTWPATDVYDFIVYTAKQCVSLEVVDKEHFGRAVLIGRARPIQVAEALKLKETDAIPLFGARADIEKEDAVPDAGELWVRFQRLEIGSSGIIGKVSSAKEDRAFLFEVKVGQILFPALLGEKVSIRIKVGDKITKTTRTGGVKHKKAMASAVQDALGGVARRCKDRGMKPEEIATLVDMDVKGVTELITNPPNSSQTEGWHEMTQEEAKKKWEAMKRYTSQTIVIEQVLGVIVPAAVVFKEKVEVTILDASKKEVASTTISLSRLASGAGASVEDLPAFTTEDKRMKDWHGEPRIQAEVTLMMRELIDPSRPGAPRQGQDTDGVITKSHSKMPAEWLNLLINRLWSRIDKALKKIMEQKVEPLINAQLRTLFHLKSFGKVNEFHFARFTLGNVSPLLGPLRVHDVRNKDDQPGVEIVIPINLQSKIDIQMKAVIAKFGAKSLDFSGELVVRLLPLLDEVPVLGGIVVFFRELPKIDLDFTGLANVLDLVPGLDTLVHGVINNVMMETLVLPNVIAVPIGTEAQGVDLAGLNTPQPLGVLKVTALRARGLVAHDWHLMSKPTSDPFLRCELSAMEWKSSTVSGTCDPDWLLEDTHNFFVYDFGQRLKLEVFDAGTLGSVLIGHARPLVVRDIIGSGKKNKVSVQLYVASSDVLGPLDKDTDQTAGVVEIQLDWYQMPDRAGGGPSSTVSWILAVKADEVFLPTKYATAACFQVTYGDRTETSKVASYKAPPPAQSAVDKAMHGVIRRCSEKGMEEAAIMEVTQYTQEHVREAIGDPDKPAHETPPPLPPVITLALERVIYICLPKCTPSAPKEVGLALLDGSKAKLAEASIPMEKLSAQKLELPRLAMKCDDGGTITMQVTLIATPLPN